MELLTAIGIKLLPALLGGLGIHLLGERKWSRVRDVARGIAADPTKTNDPREAVGQALLQVQLDRLAKEAERVKDAFVVNGSNPYPKGDKAP